MSGTIPLTICVELVIFFFGRTAPHIGPIRQQTQSTPAHPKSLQNSPRRVAQQSIQPGKGKLAKAITTVQIEGRGRW
eukprot:5112521-Karenia_brevis.AAC.1